MTTPPQPQPSPGLHLPDDLVAFLSAGLQLAYDPDPCEAGAITLLPLSALRAERFPVETSGLAARRHDPHSPGVNSYLVLGVNLVADSDTYDDQSSGILMWLPTGRRCYRRSAPTCTWTGRPAPGAAPTK